MATPAQNTAAKVAKKQAALDAHEALAAVHAKAKADAAAKHQAAIVAKQTAHNSAVKNKQDLKAAKQAAHQAALDAKQQQKLNRILQKSGILPNTVDPNASPNGSPANSDLTPGGANGDVSGTGGVTSGVIDTGTGASGSSGPVTSDTAPAGFIASLSTTQKVIFVGGAFAGLVGLAMATGHKGVTAKVRKIGGMVGIKV